MLLVKSSNLKDLESILTAKFEHSCADTARDNSFKYK